MPNEAVRHGPPLEIAESSPGTESKGLEVTVTVGDATIRVAELGLGERALIARLKALIEERIEAAQMLKPTTRKNH